MSNEVAAWKSLPTTKVTESPHHGSASQRKRDCASQYLYYNIALCPCSIVPLTANRVGDSAKNAFHSNPENTVFDAKRLIGRKFDDVEVQRDRKHWPFQLISKGGKPSIKVKHRGDTRDFVSIPLQFSMTPSYVKYRLLRRSAQWYSLR